MRGSAVAHREGEWELTPASSATDGDGPRTVLLHGKTAVEPAEAVCSMPRGPVELRSEGQWFAGFLEAQMAGNVECALMRSECAYCGLPDARTLFSGLTVARTSAASTRRTERKPLRTYNARRHASGHDFPKSAVTLHPQDATQRVGWGRVGWGV